MVARVIVLGLAALLALGAGSCRQEKKGPTCCDCYAFSPTCAWSGQVRSIDGFDDCESACNENTANCGDAHGSECAPPQSAESTKSPLTQLEDTCAAGKVALCQWTIDGFEATSKSGTCSTDPVFLRTCIVMDTIYLYDTACVASATISADGVFAGATCSSPPEVSSGSSTTTTVTFSGTLSGSKLNATRIYQRDTMPGDGGADSVCEGTQAVTYGIAGCQ